MIEDDGRIHVTCEYCATVYALEPDEVVAAQI
jgi:molecular chaperone Hsp33